jgi:site-specific recombinase XerD
MSALTAPRASTSLPWHGRDAMKVSTLARDYTLWLSTRGASPRTINNYETSYVKFVEHLHQRGVTDDVAHFTPEHVESFIDAMVQSRLKASSITVRLAALSSLGTFGTRTKDRHSGRYHLAENPLTRVYRPKRQRPVERYLYPAEIKALLAVEADAASKLVVEMLVDTSLRASELANANVEHLSQDGDRLFLAVVVKGGKPRTIRLGQRVGALLLESLRLREAEPSDPLLCAPRGGRYSRTTLSEMVQRLAIRAGVTRIQCRAHVLRHSIASLASGAGVDVPTIARMLNHADLATVSHYVHRHDAVDAAREAVRQMLRPE